MTRVLSYNILAGGYSLRENGARRVSQLVNIIRSTQPDIVGVVEATDPQIKQRPLVIEEIAAELGMQLVMGGEPIHSHDYQLAFLTHLPVVYTRIHPRPGLLNKPLLEVCVEEANGQHLTVFVTHLWAAFSHGRGGNGLRQREVHTLLQLMKSQKGNPHLLLGDFNSMAPGDSFKASNLLRYVVAMDSKRTPGLVDGHPHLNFVVPPGLRLFNPLLRVIPRNPLLSSMFDGAASLYAPRGSVALLRNAGYVDCYRQIHPHARGFTCPAGAPAGRIDYIFASPELAPRLETCYTVLEGKDLHGSHASDHLAVAAEFGNLVHIESREEDETTDKQPIVLRKRAE